MERSGVVERLQGVTIRGVGAAALLLVMLDVVGGCSGNSHRGPSAIPVPTAPSTSTVRPDIATPTTTATRAVPPALPPIALTALPVPTFTCPPGLYRDAPANLSSGLCLPPAFVFGASASDTACPAGSTMSMGPLLCGSPAGIVAPVKPGPNTCSNPGRPCPSSSSPLPPGTPVIPWSSVRHVTAGCPPTYYLASAAGDATCVAYGYLPGGTASDPNANTACPPGSRFETSKEAGSLCVENFPYEVVAPVRPTN